MECPLKWSNIAFVTLVFPEPEPPATPITTGFGCMLIKAPFASYYLDKQGDPP